MSKTPRPQESDESIQLKDPLLAAFLAWLVPGLGHLYQGRVAKAVLLFVCIMGTFTFGAYLGGSKELGRARTVCLWWRPGDKRYHYLCQIGVGLPATPALVQAYRASHGREPLWGGFMAPPRPGPGDVVPDATQLALRNQPTLSQLNAELGRYFEMSTVYTMIAGLLNILAIFDAFAGPALPAPKKDDDENDGGDPHEKEKEKDKGGKESDAGEDLR